MFEDVDDTEMISQDEVCEVADDRLFDIDSFFVGDTCGVEDELTPVLGNASGASTDVGSNANVVEESFEPAANCFLDDLYYRFVFGMDDVVTGHHFVNEGNFDSKNGVEVIGDVAKDIEFVSQQTEGSCSLMAQEQFVHRYIGQEIPEEYLTWQGGKWGVYSPESGTDYDGQAMVLDHFHIPYERYSCGPSIETLNKALCENKDAIINVSAREFYDSAECPPDEGHAVAVVGMGVNPTTKEIAGYYVTDSNIPNAAHFVEVSKLANSWYGDFIAIPNRAA